MRIIRIFPGKAGVGVNESMENMHGYNFDWSCFPWDIVAENTVRILDSLLNYDQVGSYSSKKQRISKGTISLIIRYLLACWWIMFTFSFPYNSCPIADSLWARLLRYFLMTLLQNYIDLDKPLLFSSLLFFFY